MTNPYTTLEEQLTDAVRQRATASATTPDSAPPPSAPPPRRGRRRRRGGLVPVLVGAVLLGGGAATAAVVLAPSGDHRAQVEQALAAQGSAMKALPACRRVATAAPRMVDDALPAWLTAKLGVLRRAATPADRFTSRITLRMGGRAVLRRSVRVVRMPDGWSYRLWLSRGVPSGFREADPVACARARHDAAIAAAATAPASVRREVAHVVDTQLAFVTRRAAGGALQLSVAAVRPSGHLVGGNSDVLRGHALPAYVLILGGRDRPMSVSALVPDGVATVRLVPRRGAAVVRPVRDNLVHATLPPRSGPRVTLEWRDATGRVVRRTRPSSLSG